MKSNENDISKFEFRVNELTKRLYEVVPLIVDVVEAGSRRPDLPIPSVEDVVRGMLVGGAGKGYEPSIKHAIRCYCRAYREMKIWEAIGKEVPEKIKAETLVYRGQELREREHQLKLLNIDIITVKVGDSVEEDMHAVNPRDLREPDSFLDAGMIAEVITPAFRWRDELGMIVIEPADVIAFKDEVEAKPQKPQVKKRKKVRGSRVPR